MDELTKKMLVEQFEGYLADEDSKKKSIDILTVTIKKMSIKKVRFSLDDELNTITKGIKKTNIHGRKFIRPRVRKNKLLSKF